MWRCPPLMFYGFRSHSLMMASMRTSMSFLPSIHSKLTFAFSSRESLLWICALIFQLFTVKIAENNALPEYEQSYNSDLTPAYITVKKIRILLLLWASHRHKSTTQNTCVLLQRLVVLPPAFTILPRQFSSILWHLSSPLNVIRIFPFQTGLAPPQPWPTYSNCSCVAPAVQHAFSYDETKLSKTALQTFFF